VAKTWLKSANLAFLADSKVAFIQWWHCMTAMLIADHPSGAENNDRPIVLVVEDDPRMSSFLDRALSAAGYRVERSADGVKALAAFASLAPEVVLLDPALPGLDGLEVARRLREQSGVPILMLAARAELEDRIAGLDAGADDYLPKPFAIEELLARLRALRRGRALAAADAIADSRHGVLSFGDVRLDQDTREASRGDRRLELRHRAFELLACFMRHPERVLSRRELLEEAWGYEFLGDSNVIEVTVGHVRQALEAGGEARLIHTVRPVGYILRVDHGPRRCGALQGIVTG
jgi:two-component system response regulator MprA